MIDRPIQPADGLSHLYHTGTTMHRVISTSSLGAGLTINGRAPNTVGPTSDSMAGTNAGQPDNVAAVPAM